MKRVFGNNDRIFFSGHPRIKVSWGKQQVLPNSFRRRSRAHRTFCRCLLKNLPSVVFWVFEICRTYLSTGVLAHNLKLDNPHDTGFIDFLEYLNSLLIDLSYLKPTMIYGVMTRRNQNAPPPNCYRHWTPEFCIRAGEPRRDQRVTSRTPAVLIPP